MENNWLKKVIEAYERGELPKGGVYHLEVAHDDGCSLLAGTGPCDCEPELTPRH